MHRLNVNSAVNYLRLRGDNSKCKIKLPNTLNRPEALVNKSTIAYMTWGLETGLMDAIGGFLNGAPVASAFSIESDV
jgi:hypothetical protein